MRRTVRCGGAPAHAERSDHQHMLAGGPALAGGLVAILTLQIRRRFSGRAIVLWATLYASFVVYVVAAG